MAAHRNGIFNVILPKQNEKDISEIPSDLRSELKIHLCENIHQYLDLALEKEVDKKFLAQTQLNFGRGRQARIVEPKL